MSLRVLQTYDLPMTLDVAKRLHASFSHDISKLTKSQREILRRATQVIRSRRKPATNARKKTPHSRDLWDKGRDDAARGVRRRSANKSYLEGYHYGLVNVKELRRAEMNPSADFIGEIVELRYERTVGKHRGLYKHNFKSRAGVWCLPDGSILIKKGRV